MATPSVRALSPERPAQALTTESIEAAVEEAGNAVPLDVHVPHKVRPRRVLGVLFVLGLTVLQVAADVVAGHEIARILARIGFLSAELPILMVALSATFDWSVRRRLSAAQGLGAGVAIATGIGCAFGALYGLVASYVPELRLHFPNGVSLLRTTLFGALYAQLYFGMWALAFVYPFAVESAGVRALEAQNLRTAAELARLRSHLEPHFLLNTLNAIAGLVNDEPREARRLLVCLGDLLRDAVLETSEVERLDKQIAWLRRYAAILEARHRGALRFAWDVAPECSSALMPRLLLQPLVENAVKHGALRRDDGAGEVTIRASRCADGGLVCSVEDNGPGIPNVAVREGAFGLQAVRRRLALEAPRATFRLESSPAGTRCVVEIAAVRG
ncbi:MAG: histidine kinase [Polyangiaceae bacterium]|nr:histidine kinase [Polyangiaceae bacterium]